MYGLTSVIVALIIGGLFGWFAHKILAGKGKVE